MNTDIELFNKNAVFISKKINYNDIFREVSEQLLELEYVNTGFLNNIIEREKKYPTGISTKPLSRKMLDVAVPHTESIYAKRNLIVPIGLLNPVKFNSMVNTKETLDVSFIFMILNSTDKFHALALSKVMDFLAKTEVEDLNQLFTCGDSVKIYKFLNSNFL